MNQYTDSASQSQEPQSKHLSPPKHLRRMTPRVCATCRFAEWDTFEDKNGIERESGILGCTRPNGPQFEAGDMNQWFYTCDRWQDETNGGQS